MRRIDPDSINPGRINPIELYGNWTEGYALDRHTEYSIYLGEDEWGHSQFDTKRTYIGQKVYDLKYKNDLLKVNEIVDLIDPFLEEWDITKKINYIIPVPPSKERLNQPVYKIAEGIGQRINKNVITDFISKNSRTQSKSLAKEQKTEISGTVIRHKGFKKKVNVLAVDDLYQSGKTLNEVVGVLKNDSNIVNIYVLTMTKTKR